MEDLSTKKPFLPKHQWLISSTFYMQIFRTNVFFSSFFYLHVEMLPKKRLYEKDSQKTLMKLTPGVDFIMNLKAAFCTRRSQKQKRH